MNTYTLTEDEAARLTDLAYTTLINRLETLGNTLSPPHKKALHAVVEAFTEMAQGKLCGRWAFGLAAGLGKSTAVVCWIAAMLHLRLEQRVSMAVAAEEVEALCALIDALEAVATVLGLSSETLKASVGLHHTKDDARRKPTPDYDKKPVLFICHARVRDKHLKQFNSFNGQPRNLLVWDESLVATYSQACRSTLLSEIAGAMARRCEREPEYQETHGEMSQYLDIIDEALAQELLRLKDISSTQAVIRLPQCSEEKLDAFKELTKGNRTVQDLLEMVPYPVKVSNIGERGVVQYQVSVPATLNNIIVLDASDPIRDLVRYDRRIRSAEEVLPSVSEKTLGAPLSKIKQYDHLTIYRMREGGGKASMRESFKQADKRNRRVCREVVEVIKHQIPQEQAVLVIVYKAISDKLGTTHFENILRDDLKAAGIDIDATIDVVEEKGKSAVKKKRLQFTTWGKHTSTNDYSYCRNEIQVGIMHRSLLDLLGNALGQVGDLNFKEEHKRLRDLQLSEVAHCCYQGINRISCRQVEGNQAKPATVWLIEYSKNLEKKLESVLPGATWLEWKKKYNDDAPKPGQMETAANVVRGYLTGLSEGIEGVSSRSVRKNTNTGVGDSTWPLVVQSAIEGTEWRKVGQRILRGKALFEASFGKETAA
jgi:hypothetical protein